MTPLSGQGSSDSSSLCLLLPLVTAWGKAVKDITFPGEDGEVIAVTDQRDARHTGGLPGRVTTLVPDLRMLFCAGVRSEERRVGKERRCAWWRGWSQIART